MKIWASSDKELRFTEIAENLVAVNVFTDEYVIGVMLTRRECEQLCLGLAEWCGIPLFNSESEDDISDESDNDRSPHGEKPI